MGIRFHLDENVSGASAQALRNRGIDVTTASDSGLIGAEDRSHLTYARPYARRSRRVILTHDDDFTRIHAEGAIHAGICYCHKEKHSIGDLVRLLLLVDEYFDEEEMQGHLEYL